MEKIKKFKTILDSVHGNISIPKIYFDEIIDTEYFQRLRRIEQNSCRSVFPSARHDRFIHSIGVYHLGARIANLIDEKFGNDGEGILPGNSDVILETYKLACLLHDVGHTPFSHTFEEFFSLDSTLNKIKALFPNKAFADDIDYAEKAAAEHEAISAFVALIAYREKFSKKDEIDWELLTRMITGYRYLKYDGNVKSFVPEKSFENAMIELIHGDIIDADGLDYVCRDVWAGGYRNFNIDISRLLNSITIIKDDDNNYSVSYSSKALNEIETVLNVKNFQYLYVINHHKVLLEQYYLVEGMKSAACYHQNLPSQDVNERENALKSLCDINIYTEKKTLEVSKYQLLKPSDDDFVALMKLVPHDDINVKAWFSRQFPHYPLWKSKLEFFNIFRSVFEKLKEEDKEEDIVNVIDSLGEDGLIKFIVDAYHNLSAEDIIVKKVKAKIRRLDESKIHVDLNGEVVPFSELKHDMFAYTGMKLPFYFVYVNIEKITDANTQQSKVIDDLKDKIKTYLEANL